MESPKKLNVEEQKLINLKENLAKKILKIAGVSDKQIDRIMNNPKMNAAMLKRAERLLKDLKVKEQDVLNIGPGNAMSNVEDKVLKENIKGQVEELVAQVGRTSVSTIETRDMRGKENLHDKYQDKAKKLDQKAFDKKMGEALEYENEKNNRNKGESFLYNTFYRKPMQLLNLLRPKGNKPLFKPWQKALMGVIAMTVIAFPLGMMLGVYMMGKALDEATATHEKPGWLTRLSEKMFGKEEERKVVNNEELEKVNVKEITEVNQDMGQDREQDRSQERQTEVVTERSPVRQDVEIDRGQERQAERVNQVEQQSRERSNVTQLNDTGNITQKDNLQKMIDSNPELRKDFERVVDGAIKSKQDRDKIIETAKEIAGKDASGKQRPMDDMDLSLAQNRVNNPHKKTNTRSI